MVLMKNVAKARAPAVVCWVATTGMTGGFSPGCVRFGPVVGTSAGTVGTAGVGAGVAVGVPTAAVDGVAEVVIGATTAWCALVQPAARQATAAIDSRRARIREWCQNDGRIAASKVAAVENFAAASRRVTAEGAATNKGLCRHRVRGWHRARR